MKMNVSEMRQRREEMKERFSELFKLGCEIEELGANDLCDWVIRNVSDYGFISGYICGGLSMKVEKPMTRNDSLVFRGYVKENGDRCLVIDMIKVGRKYVSIKEDIANIGEMNGKFYVRATDSWGGRIDAEFKEGYYDKESIEKFGSVDDYLKRVV